MGQVSAVLKSPAPEEEVSNNQVVNHTCFVCCSPNAQSDIALKAGKSVYLLFNQLGNLEKKAGDDKQ